MGNEKYVAYVSTYTAGKGDNHGIKIYDVDVEIRWKSPIPLM